MLGIQVYYGLQSQVIEMFQQQIKEIAKEGIGAEFKGEELLKNFYY